MKLIASCLLGLLLANAATAAPATLTGDSVDAAVIRTLDNGSDPVGRITGYGLDAPFTVVDGNSDIQDYSSTFTLDVDGGRFTLQFLTFGGWQAGIVFRLSDLDFSPAGGVLSSLTVDTNMVGYALTVGPDSIDIGLENTQFTADTYFTGTFNVSSVPEPSSTALLGVRLAGFAMATRRAAPRARRRRPAMA